MDTPKDLPQKPRSLTVVPRKDLRDRAADMTQPMRQWWKQKNIDKLLQDADIGQAISDVAMMSLAHMARRLSSSKTPDRVKDELAKVVSPRVAIQLMGKAPGSREHRGEAASSLLEAYKVPKKP